MHRNFTLGKPIVTAMALSVLLAIGFVPPAAADSMSSDNGVTSYEVGTEVSYIRYEEPDIMDETGVMYGIYAKADANVEGLALGAEGTINFGQVDYDSASTGSIDGINDFLAEVRATVGYNLTPDKKVEFTPYIGLGYRYLLDQLGGETSTTGALGYDRESNYLYLPIGIKAETGMDNGWTLGGTVEFDVFLHGWQKSHLEDAIAGLDTLTNDQDEGYGVRGSIKIAKKMDRVNILVEPFVRYWNIKQSNTKAVTFGGTPIGVVGYEPKNNSLQVGGRIGVEF